MGIIHKPILRIPMNQPWNFPIDPWYFPIEISYMGIINFP